MDTENQQATVTEGELGWLAAIIEGEGSIVMNARKKSWKGWNGVGVDCTIAVSNTDGLIIEKVRNIFLRLTGRQPFVYEIPKSPIYKADGGVYINPKTVILNISVNRMEEILLVLRAIEPHIAGEKAARARLLISFIERRLKRKTKHSVRGSPQYDRYDWETVKKFYELKRKPLPPEVIRVLNEHEQRGGQSA